ncbi:MAG: ankyrin repeat domain-containing protein [Alphaproteobacteria bacterium]|nr:ankyrin repeat domain-containing protein [Alphaproteobacteria bacterium]
MKHKTEKENGGNLSNKETKIEQIEQKKAEEVKKPEIKIVKCNALHYAARAGDTNMVKMLLKDGDYDINALGDTTGGGSTPLMLACINDHREIVNLLIKAGADVNIVNKAGWTALHYAARSSHFENFQIAKALIENGADLNVLANVDDVGKWTPLILAARNGNERIAEALIEKGADLNVADKHGWTALHYAARDNYVKIAKALIENGADLNKLADVRDSGKWTPLILAVHNDNDEIAEALIKKGADLNVADKHGWTALHYASRDNRVRIVKALIEKGADLNVKTKDGWTPLHLAVYNKHKEISNLLVEHGADIKIKNEDGRKAFDYYYGKLDNNKDAQISIVSNFNGKVQNQIFDRTHTIC